jgi:hypothetical protein
MDFQFFLEYVPDLVEAKLPAMAAHIKMAPFARIESLRSKGSQGLLRDDASLS